MDMNVISEDPRIIDLDGYAYLIKDKFICFREGLLDLTDPEDRTFLLEYADFLYGKTMSHGILAIIRCAYFRRVRMGDIILVSVMLMHCRGPVVG